MKKIVLVSILILSLLFVGYSIFLNKTSTGDPAIDTVVFLGELARLAGESDQIKNSYIPSDNQYQKEKRDMLNKAKKLNIPKSIPSSTRTELNHYRNTLTKWMDETMTENPDRSKIQSLQQELKASGTAIMTLSNTIAPK